MSDFEHMDDDELLTELRAAVAEADLVTDRQREAARAAFTWRTVDEELAELLHDSALEAGLAVRSGGDDVRTLSFASGALTLEIEIDGELVMGQVTGGSAQHVVLQRTGAEDRQVNVDSSGFFRISDVASGPVRFVVSVGDFTLTSPWVAL